jgi:hypothetical protein
VPRVLRPRGSVCAIEHSRAHSVRLG